MKTKYLIVMLGLCFLFPLNILAQTWYADFTYYAAGNRLTLSYGYNKKSVEQQYPNIIEGHDISIYPNPTPGYLNVKVTNLKKDELTGIEIVDINGKTIFKKERITEVTDIDLNNNPNGFYMMKIIVGDKSLVWKIIKEQ